MSDWQLVIFTLLEVVAISGGMLLGAWIGDKVTQLQEKRKNSKKAKKIDR
ncbi:MAG: hypothetical protein KBT03_13025 [Bacteroidales bacterium]|nr:hypothetical protein [Candidatus Scybalousia scybalohippi]